MSDGFSGESKDLVDPIKGRLLCQEPAEQVRKKKIFQYIFGFSMIGVFFLLTLWALMSNKPQIIIIFVWIGGPGVFLVVWTKFLLPISVYENGIEWGLDFPSILSDNIIFLSWGELGVFREHEKSYYFEDSVENKKVFVRKSWPGAEEAIDLIRDRINLMME